jgi:hypothetical protein
MTTLVPIKFKLVSTAPDEGGTKVTWVVGFHQDGKTSTGHGWVTVPQDTSGMSEDAILSVALSAQGGMNLVDNLTEIHAALLSQKAENALFDDWYTSYLFMCAKQNKTPDPKETARQNMAQGLDTYGVMYTHSIFNITTQGHWSHTFQYDVAEELGGMTYHVKVRDGAAAEWYKHSDTLMLGDIPVKWLALDLATGAPIEYYFEGATDDENIIRVEKYDAVTHELLTSTTHDHTVTPTLPADFSASLVELGFDQIEHIFGFAEKSYGKIVEYKFTPK